LPAEKRWSGGTNRANHPAVKTTSQGLGENRGTPVRTRKIISQTVWITLVPTRKRGRKILLGEQGGSKKRDNPTRDHG